MYSKGFVDILAAEQTPENNTWFQGTADAVRQSLPRILDNDFEHILILSGDQLYQMDFRKLFARHLEEDADITIATIPVNRKDATAFGILKVDADNSIHDFYEKPDESIVDEWRSEVEEEYAEQEKYFLASMGIYLFKKEVMLKMFEENPDATDFGKEIIPAGVRDDECKIVSYPFGGYWTDIGSISSFFQACLEMTQFLPQFNFYDNRKKIYTRARILAPTKVFGTKLQNVMISDGCILHADSVSDSVIGIRSRIGKNSVIKRSVIMGSDYYQSLYELQQNPHHKLLGIGENCYLENVITDRNVCIGNDVYIRGGNQDEFIETDQYCIRDGIVVLKKGVEIKDGTRIVAEEITT
jgi:glucose-1-phosphate adenylyltransferase